MFVGREIDFLSVKVISCKVISLNGKCVIRLATPHMEGISVTRNRRGSWFFRVSPSLLQLSLSLSLLFIISFSSRDFCKIVGKCNWLGETPKKGRLHSHNGGWDCRVLKIHWSLPCRFSYFKSDSIRNLTIFKVTLSKCCIIWAKIMHSVNDASNTYESAWHGAYWLHRFMVVADKRKGALWNVPSGC